MDTAVTNGFSVTGVTTSAFRVAANTTNAFNVASGTIANVINIAAVANITNLFKFNAIAGCILSKDVNPKDVPSGGGLGADACIRIDIGGADYFIPLFTTELS
jgi:hypothetical protein